MLGIDIGNTNLKIGKFRKNRLEEVYLWENDKVNKSKIRKVLANQDKTEPILVCSVVPKMNSFFSGFKKNIKIVGKDIKVPIKCNYNKKQVGSDRLLAAYAAKQEQPAARMILDFGTAITLDFLSKRGDYLGGIILPGINSTLKTFKNCALLPNHLEIKKSRKTIPTNTAESINKGLQQGFSLMLNSLISKYRGDLKLSGKDKILVTGGDFLVLKPYLTFNFEYKKHLVLKGLFHLYQKYFSYNL